MFTIPQLRWSLLGALAAAALLLAACGGSEPTVEEPLQQADPGGSGEVGTEAALEEAATASFAAFVNDDDLAYFDSLSIRCRETLGFTAVEDHLLGRRISADSAGMDLSVLSASQVEVDGFSGVSGEVTLTIAGTDEIFEEGLPQLWVFEEGEWYLDECSDITGPQGGLEGLGTDGSDAIAIGGIGDLNGWLVFTRGGEALEESDLIELGGVDPAAKGNRLFTASVNLTYNGADASVTVGDQLGFAIVSGATVYGDETSCDSTFYGFDLTEEISPGDDAVGIVCREVAAEHGGFLLRITHLPTGDTIWFELS
ncbi:MAG: hypothetical protein ACC658_07415 [Acidimicrobiia bacterium]